MSVSNVFLGALLWLSLSGLRCVVRVMNNAAARVTRRNAIRATDDSRAAQARAQLQQRGTVRPRSARRISEWASSMFYYWRCLKIYSYIRMNEVTVPSKGLMQNSPKKKVLFIVIVPKQSVKASRWATSDNNRLRTLLLPHTFTNELR